MNDQSNVLGYMSDSRNLSRAAWAGPSLALVMSQCHQNLVTLWHYEWPRPMSLAAATAARGRRHAAQYSGSKPRKSEIIIMKWKVNHRKTQKFHMSFHYKGLKREHCHGMETQWMNRRRGTVRKWGNYVSTEFWWHHFVAKSPWNWF